MGFFKDLKQLKQTADAMTPQEYKGVGGMMRLSRDGMAQMNEALGSMAEESQRANHLAAVGRPGTATITALRDTGATVNEHPIVELDLQVSVDGGAPYPVTIRQTINRLFTANFQPGNTVSVKVDPADPSSVIVA